VSIRIAHGERDIAIPRLTGWFRREPATRKFGVEADHIVAVDVELYVLAAGPSRLGSVRRTLIRVISGVEHDFGSPPAQLNKMRKPSLSRFNFRTGEQHIESKGVTVKSDRGGHIENFDVRG